MIELINTHWPLSPQDTLSALLVFACCMLVYITTTEW